MGFVSVLLLFISGCSYHSNFTDRGLEQRFRSHTDDFCQLVQMLNEDFEVSIVTPEAAYQAYDIKATISASRLHDYQVILKKLDLGSVSRPPGTGQIYFAVWNRSDFPAGGTNEYFVYAESAPAEAQYLVESLDSLRTQTDAYAFKKIDDRWYLHVDNW
jgi:hypothetical protein